MTLSSVARRVAAAVVCTTVSAAALSPVRAQADSRPLAIRVYDFSALDHPVRTTAVDEARAIVADAGVAASWHDCTRRESCAPERGDLVIRVVREVGTPSSEWRRSLGYSVIDPVAGTGTLATVYINRVEDSAHHAGADLALLLGRAIAHEVGHLILHTNQHGEQGLMRAIWTEQEIARNAPGDWVFASPERRQIRAARQRAVEVRSSKLEVRRPNAEPNLNTN